eukprot:1168932-Prymnesium_polylepis.1
MVHAPATRRVMKAFAQTAWHGLNVSRASSWRVLTSHSSGNVWTGSRVPSVLIQYTGQSSPLGLLL